MNPLFGRKEKKHRQINEGKIKRILATEKILKEAEYNHGKLFLTKNYLIWKKIKNFDSEIIPLKSIIKSEKKLIFKGGYCLKVIHGADRKESIFHLEKGGIIKSSQINDIQDWASTLNTGVSTNIFPNLMYAGGHSTYPEKHNGKIIVKPSLLIFTEMKGIRQNSKGNFKLEIPLHKIKNVSIKTASEINRLSTVLVRSLWRLGNPVKSKFVCIQYKDEKGIDQIPFFDFPFDRDDKTKHKLIRAIHDSAS